MAATADKARFYLEQSIPELREFERKNVFSKEEEISNIIKKRSDFEHKLNARGARSTDFARYIEFEIQLEALRKKRTKRLGIKIGKHHGNRRIFQVLDRATKKFHGDLSLWMQYLGVCRQQKSYKKINEVLSNVIRMHPTKSEVWIYAASYSMQEQGDMIEARSYMQRGLRFCRDSQEMWLTYARLELLYISKIHARQRVLGVRNRRQDNVTIEDDVDGEADMIVLPSLTAQDLNGSSNTAQEGIDSLDKLSSTPALSGAIPVAIFDAAIKQFPDPQFGSQFLNMMLEFQSLPCLHKITDHIVQNLMTTHSSSSFALDCYIRQPLISVQPGSTEYPQALSTTFVRLKQALSDHPSANLTVKTVTWLTDSLIGDLQEEIKQALFAILLRVLRLAQNSNQLKAKDIINLLRRKPNIDSDIVSICLDIWPNDDELRAFATQKLDTKELTFHTSLEPSARAFLRTLYLLN